ncbi:unnamed protein product [Schistocephalus solidus]|uniref:Fibulin-1 n=1 Tax=Schistocephalus solidus TaxID=70667 RepID=A0A183SF57_SCHSO|nr:unnamed protein product [Schistocephalus solidus]
MLFIADIDECKFNRTICRRGYKCRNILGSYQCIRQVPCGFGYILNPETQDCEDEIQVEIVYLVQVGTNSMRNFHPAMSDINECALNQTLCRPFEKCVNRPGDFICEPKLRCKWGMQINANGTACEGSMVSLLKKMPASYLNLHLITLVDIDECATGIAKCGLNMHCENTIGSYRCLCQRGYKNVNDTACVEFPCIADIDECKVFSSIESCADPRARCVNTAGSYKCICPNGFVWHSYPVYACKDVNECVITPDICGHGHKCVNEEGGYRCECANGFRTGMDNQTCVEPCFPLADVNECSESSGGCKDGICVNTPGGFRCDCPSGYRLSDQHQCVGTLLLRCHLKPEHACRAYDHGCLRDRPLLIENYHIELVAPMKHEQLLAEVDSSIIVNGTVRAELRVHYAYQMRSNLHMSTEDAFKLRLKSPDSRFVDVVLLRPLEAPADLLISANLFAVRGRMRALKSVTKLYIFTTETAQQQAAFERQQHRLLRGRGY